MVHPPTRIDMWDEYVRLRVIDFQNGDENARTAFAYYEDNRKAMDEGAVVSNPNRYDKLLAFDGLPRELSAIQHYYNRVADTSPDAVACELDNDPPEEGEDLTGDVTPQTIQRQTTGVPRGIIPPGCTVLTHGVDVGKWRLHWVVRAWKPDATGYTIDYGTQDVHGAQYGSDIGLDAAIHAAIIQRHDEFLDAAYMTPDGEKITETVTLVDASYRTDAVYAACMAIRQGIWPVMGFGKSMGCVKMNFSPGQKATKTMKPGDGFKLSKVGKVWLVEADADRWKRWEHDRWMTAVDQPGRMHLFGELGEPDHMSQDQFDHTNYAKHICSEVEREEFHHGVLRKRWRAVSKENHWLDASYYADVAAAMRGIRLSMAETRAASKIPEHKPAQERKRVTLAELAKKAGRS